MTTVTEKEFKCPSCKKTYNFLVINSLTPEVGKPEQEMKPPKCTYCGAEYYDER